MKNRNGTAFAFSAFITRTLLTNIQGLLTFIIVLYKKTFATPKFLF